MRQLLSAAVFLLVCPIALAQSYHFHQHALSTEGGFSPCGAKTFQTDDLELNTDMQTVNWPVSGGVNVSGEAAEKAQKFFNQGMTEYYGFNFEAAMRSFHKAKTLDPSMAMAPWGIALAAGPNINLGMGDECRKVAMRESACAVDRARSSGVKPVEQQLIEALTLRYTSSLTETVAYGMAMQQIWAETTRGPKKDWNAANVANVGALYAESLLNMRPWGLYDAAYRPALNTEAINTVLTTAIETQPDTIGANHLYIHAIEASAFPRCGLESADVLVARTHPKFQEAPGHLVHMPSHIYLRLGNYARAMELNAEAAEADRHQFKTVCAADSGQYCPQVYYGHYLSHNLFFAAVSAAFIGKSAEALDWAIQTRDHAGRFVANEPGLQRYLAAPLMMQVMNQQWTEIADEEQHLPQVEKDCYVAKSADGCHILKAMRHWAQGIAYTQRPSPQNLAQASSEYDQMAKEMDDIQRPGPTGWGNNSAAAVLAVAQSTLQAYYTWMGGQSQSAGSCNSTETKALPCVCNWQAEAKRCNNIECERFPTFLSQAVEHLKLAVTHEDALVYDEPPQWFPPAREALGGAYIRMAQADDNKSSAAPELKEEADKLYRMAGEAFDEELARHPGSARPLYGKWVLLKIRGGSGLDEAQNAFCDAWGGKDDMSLERLWPAGNLFRYTQTNNWELHCPEGRPLEPPPIEPRPSKCQECIKAQQCPTR